MWWRGSEGDEADFREDFGIIMLKLNCAQHNFIQIEMSGVPNLKYKTSLCNAWREGLVCQKAQFCFFAHGEPQLRTMEQNREFLMQHSPHLLPHSVYKFKTSYCKFYSKGDCKLGESCSFAHNKLEKRQKSYVPKQQAYQDASMYPPYSQYYQQYTQPMPQIYPFYPGYPTVQFQVSSPQSHKSQQGQEKMEITEQQSPQAKTGSPLGDTHSL